MGSLGFFCRFVCDPAWFYILLECIIVILYVGMKILFIQKKNIYIFNGKKKSMSNCFYLIKILIYIYETISE